MLAKRSILALLAVGALSALASPTPAFTIQDPENLIVSDSICHDTEGAQTPPKGPQIRLDNGVFIGKTVGKADKFLGIPFALPP
jgi:hypothetical protein